MSRPFVRRPQRNDGADPEDIACGYYLVREGSKWRVVRWMPQAGRWVIGGAQTWPPRYWDEIGERAA